MQWMLTKGDTLFLNKLSIHNDNLSLKLAMLSLLQKPQVD